MDFRNLFWEWLAHSLSKYRDVFLCDLDLLYIRFNFDDFGNIILNQILSLVAYSIADQMDFYH